MVHTSAFAETAALAGDPARANMLLILMGGKALTAKELAQSAGITPQTASGHLARLTEGGLVAVAQQGRHRYHRIASNSVAQMLERIMFVAAGNDAARLIKPVRVGPRDAALRHARTCYNHLAGQLAVRLADRLVECAHIELSPEGGRLTRAGATFLTGLGVDLKSDHRQREGSFCRPCLDWSERRTHVAGVVGTALCSFCFDQGWLKRVDGTRAVSVTASGRRGFAHAFDIRIDASDGR